MSGWSFTSSWRPLLADAPPLAFRLRERVRDFWVEEIPRRPPEGEGQHTWIEVEKVGIPTDAAARRLERALGLRPGAVAWAGRKDARAVARQWLSVEGLPPERVRSLELAGLRVLRAERARRRLGPGALSGNRFRLRLAGLEDLAPAREVLDAVVRRGLPNWFGPQRFGRGGSGAELGRLLAIARLGDYLDLWLTLEISDPTLRSAARRALETGGDLPEGAARALSRALLPHGRGLARRLARGERQAETLVAALPKPLRRLHLAAFQARGFQEVLARREWPLALRAGDLAWIHASGAVFGVSDPAREAPRAEALEISPSGPLFGRRTSAPAGEPGRLEEEVRGGLGLAPAGPLRCAGLAPPRGARRPLRVPVEEARLEPAPGGAELRFRLPAGSFATALCAELRRGWEEPPGRRGSSAPPAEVDTVRDTMQEPFR